MASSLITSGLIANADVKPKSTSIGNALPGGVLTAALTPLDKDLNADHARLVKYLQWLLMRGNNGIGLLGTTGEANSFSVNERLQILIANTDRREGPRVCGPPPRRVEDSRPIKEAAERSAASLS